MPKNVRDLGKLIVAKGFKKSPKVQKIARSGHSEREGGGREKTTNTTTRLIVIQKLYFIWSE